MRNDGTVLGHRPPRNETRAVVITGRVENEADVIVGADERGKRVRAIYVSQLHAMLDRLDAQEDRDEDDAGTNDAIRSVIEWLLDGGIDPTEE